jgi:outer membrane protein assembly factor BamA
MKAVHLTRLIFILFFCMAGKLAHAQYSLAIKAYNPKQEKSVEGIIKQVKINDSFTDSLTRKKALNNVLVALYGNGYLAASFDSFAVDTTKLTAFLNQGEVYKWLHLSKGNIDEGLISEAGFREKIYRNKPVNMNDLRKIQDRVLTFAENNGYPFSEIRLDSVRIASNGINAALVLHKGAFITVDSIIVKGNARLSETYLHNYLGIKKKMPYNEAIMSQISTRLQELPMVSETRKFNISFHEDKATVYLYLEDKKASQLDGVIGVLPDNSEAGKITVTGDVHLRLHSSFGYGELFDLNWKQPQPKTQDLKIKFNYPFLFSTPFGLDLNLSIYKKDTTYLELQRNFGVQYLLTGGNYYKAFYNNLSSSLIDVKQFEFATTLPPFADISTNSYGLGLRLQHLDYRLNPRNGYLIEGTASVGVKNIKQNQGLKNVDYDSIQLKSTQYKGEITADYFLPAFNRSVIDIGSIAGYLQSPDIFENEMYRLGGLKTLRGFDEESILASRFVIGKLEYRYIIETNSYLFLFVNSMYYERRQLGAFVHDVPFGFGTGITFETKLGIFSLNYALGREFTNPIVFRAAKIHFGLINYF